jgi:hypothetical protein
MKKTLYFLAVFVAAGVTLPAANLVINGDFSTAGCVGSTTVPGWTINGTYDTAMCQSGSGSLGAGNPGAWVELNSAPGVPVSISQVITGLTVGASYTLSFDIRNGYGFMGSASPVAGVSINGATDLLPLSTSMAWTTNTYTFVASSSTTTLSLLSQQNGSDVDAGFDNISLTPSAVSITPEPSTLLMLGAGFGLIAIRRLRLS